MTKIWEPVKHAVIASPVMLAALALTLSGCPRLVDSGSRSSRNSSLLDSSITVVNGSTAVISAIYVADIRDRGYGPNVAPDELFPDEDVLVLVECGTYDVLVIDEFDYECELFDLELCFDDLAWFVTDADLVACPAYR